MTRSSLALAASLAAFAVAAATNQSAGQQNGATQTTQGTHSRTDEGQPGNNVAPHVPSQNEQAQDAPITALASAGAPADWWSPSDGRTFPEYLTYANASGELGLLNASGAFDTRGHPFFEPIGRNGRACVSCHQPADGMGLSLRSIRERWQETQGQDPIFAAIDGSNCPHLPQGDKASHSLLLERGLFRIFLPWPPKDSAGGAMEPEFSIEVVRDPTGCNTHPEYGLTSDNPMISIYRRPRPVANMTYLTHQGFGVDYWRDKDGQLATRDENGRPANMNMMADARHATLQSQAVEAAVTHLQFDGALTPAQQAEIRAFEEQLYVAQVALKGAGSLIGKGGPPAFGPYNLRDGKVGELGNNTNTFVFPMGDAWTGADAGESGQQRSMRASIRRGHDVYFLRTFWIKDSMHLNTVGFGNPTKRTCATCHQMHMIGSDVANGWIDIGTTNLPWAKEQPRNPWNAQAPDLPLFKITCRDDVAPHAFLSRTIYTQDPGRALITGKCVDVGAIVMQQFRGLAARAPYFVNGSAANLREMVDYYDRRYDIGLTEQEKIDLENFMASL
jgi:hypothetical protein